ncbi:MAG TPA: EVE domain-containing protein [Pirellulaceae bacterium]|nr:EVE domain-containing protein [Pirellulaceae bacterium]HMO94017.1 EVE domain-containing protein [Pirellulaceae bacterium]HMP70778.1 EVE domain-containing protein [Pirellulaceae bacterium]
MSKQKYWLFKTEPTVFSVDDFVSEPKQTTLWEGVRNYQARNYLRDEVNVGDLAFIYHSNSKSAGIAGIMKVVKPAYPDFTAFDRSNQYFDPKSKLDAPTWYMVDVQLLEKFPQLVSLERIKATPTLKEMVLVKNSRLSIQPVTKSEFKVIEKLAKAIR